jgi:isocitrate dehydrogenase
MKFTEGSFRDWGYDLAREEFRRETVTERESWILDAKDKNSSVSVEAIAAVVEPGSDMAPEAFRQKLCAEVKICIEAIYPTHGNGQWKQKILVNDRIADSMLQQILTRADEYEVVCTPNLNGDYLSDACAAQIGGLGLAPGANIGDEHGVFEATHGTAPKYADKDVINPSGRDRSGALMFEFMGWAHGRELIGALALPSPSGASATSNVCDYGRHGTGDSARVLSPARSSPGMENVDAAVA